MHGEFFSDEINPLDGSPSVLINQMVEQNQSVVLQLLIQSEIDSRINKYAEGTPERNFIEWLKGSLGTVANIGQFISMLFKLAKDFGLSIDQAMNIFG